jgi:hypothetical protein
MLLTAYILGLLTIALAAAWAVADSLRNPNL